MNPYETLGVDKSADDATIKRAYRKKAMKAHPDKGGDKEEFHAIQRSYDILADPKRRSNYDRHGETGTGPDPNQVAISTIANIMMQLVDNADVDSIDLIGAIADNIKNTQGKMKDAIANTHKAITKRERAIKRLKRKSGGENLLVMVLEGDIRQKRGEIEAATANMEVGTLALNLLADYQYHFNKRAAPTALPQMFVQVARYQGMQTGP